jgi:hypothetical protein
MIGEMSVATVLAIAPAALGTTQPATLVLWTTSIWEASWGLLYLDGVWWDGVALLPILFCVVFLLQVKGLVASSFNIWMYGGRSNCIFMWTNMNMSMGTLRVGWWIFTHHDGWCECAVELCFSCRSLCICHGVTMMCCSTYGGRNGEAKESWEFPIYFLDSKEGIMAICWDCVIVWCY